ncbi:MAG: phosphoenolpyruvate carboxykinase (GTP), partial [Burkholderiales bacterium]|nr:phosphoenolpyruvate carboxykinase (GTP) [Burkholderiales bacterium]
ERVDGGTTGEDNAFGVSPRYDDLSWDGLSFTREQFESMIGLDGPAWRQELALHTELFDQLVPRLPAELLAVKAKIEQRLAA